MSPLKRSNNIAARMGRWSASHWKTAVFGWLAFVVLAVFIGMQVGTKTLKMEDSSVGQSHKADQILKKAFPQIDPQTEIVLVQSSGKALDKMFTDQLKLAGERSIPITIIVLLLVFGALIAVSIPLLLALTSVIATVFLVSLPSQLVPMDQNVDAVVLLIGLAVGVDYSLFYIKRERE